MKNSHDLTGDYVDYLADESRQIGHAEWISFPETEDDIVESMHHCHVNNLTVTLQSGRTGITGGAVPEGGAIVNVSRMTKVLGMRRSPEGTFHVRIQPGVTLQALRDALLDGGNFDVSGWDEDSLKALEAYRSSKYPHVFPPDLTESGACFGGVVACNGSGARSFLFGPTRPHISALRVVLVDGEIISLRRGREQAKGFEFTVSSLSGKRYQGCVPQYSMPSVKNAAGFYATADMDLIDLFIGSEGVLGCVSEIELALTRMPSIAWGITAFLPSESAALQWVEQARTSYRNSIAAMEFFSGEALDLLRRQRQEHPDTAGGIPELKDAWHSAVYIEIFGEDEDAAEEQLMLLGELLEKVGGSMDDTWLATHYREIETFKGVRHAVPEAVNRLVSERKKQYPDITKLGTDLSVPDERLQTVMTMYHEDLRKAGLEYVIFGHIGNNHLHVNILPRNPEDYATGKALYLTWAHNVVSMGGSVSAEHGIGKLKKQMLEIMYGEEGIAQMRAVKRAFDPSWRLNPDTLFSA